MINGAINSNAYNVVLALHLFAVILGTGAAFTAPIVKTKLGNSNGISGVVTESFALIMSPALLLSGIFGGALVGMSDNVYDFGQMWLTLAGIFWLIAVASVAILYQPAFLTLPDTEKYKPLLSPALHISLAVMLVVMVWKPGL